MFDNLKTKIRYFIKKIFLNSQYKNKYSTTYKGSYLIQYLLDVYINKTKKDYIEEYENMINSTLEKMEQQHWLENLQELIGLKLDEDNVNKKEFASVQLFGMLCYMLNEDEKDKALSQINSSIIRNFIKKFYLNEKLSVEDYKDIEHERTKAVEEMNDNT